MSNKLLEVEALHSRIWKASGNEFTTLLRYAAAAFLKWNWDQWDGRRQTLRQFLAAALLARIQEIRVGLTAILSWSKL